MVFNVKEKKPINPAIVSETMSDMFMEDDEEDVPDTKPVPFPPLPPPSR